jgi:hypothetical protein
VPGEDTSSPGMSADMIAGVSWCRWGTDARLSRWSAPRTNDLDSLLGILVALVWSGLNQDVNAIVSP